MMTKILNVAEAVMYVSDIPRAKEFYTTVLGLPIALEFFDAIFLQTGPTSTLILFDLEELRQRESIIPAHGAEGQGHVALAIPADEMDVWRERLAEYDVEIEFEMDWPTGAHSIYFRDPDENSVELIGKDHYQRIWERLEAEREK